MLSLLQNWRTWLAIVAIAIVSGTIWYSQYLSGKIADEERNKVLQWAEAGKLLLFDSTGMSNQLVGLIISGNNDIPIIETDEHDSIVSFVNIDTTKLADPAGFVAAKLLAFKDKNEPIIWINPFDSTQMNRYYYGSSLLYTEVSYYPIIQLCIVGLFILITVLSLQTRNKSIQNQLWAGMAKETAHQLGTPVTSLEGWLEVLQEQDTAHALVPEMRKDVERLKLISDRFGKIGSIPQLELCNIVAQTKGMVDYIRRRSSGKVILEMHANEEAPVMALISPPLFDWVVENLLKNALDAMVGTGKIDVSVFKERDLVVMEISDTGKGIARKHWDKVFAPGYTTKKRGWGLGLSLTKRIVEQFHGGRIFVKRSELGKGSVFRVEWRV